MKKGFRQTVDAKHVKFQRELNDKFLIKVIKN